MAKNMIDSTTKYWQMASDCFWWYSAITIDLVWFLSILTYFLYAV